MPSGPSYAALCTSGQLYVEYVSGERELYNYGADPYELDNVLTDWEGHTPSPEAEALAAPLAARLIALQECAGASCV